MAVIDKNSTLVSANPTMGEEELIKLHNTAWNSAQCARIIAERNFREAQGFILREGSLVTFTKKGIDKVLKGTIIQNCSNSFPLVVILRKGKHHLVKAKRIVQIIKY